MIKLVKATGKGNTKLGAFDNALYNCGIHNHNLIYLSSVIPSGQEVRIVNKFEDSQRWGSKLYVVMAHEESTKLSNASIGWLYELETGNGLFVEHDGKNSVELSARALQDLADTRGIENYHRCVYHIDIKNKEKGKWVCAMVVAVFEEEDWRTL